MKRPGPSEFTAQVQASPHRTVFCALHVGPAPLAALLPEGLTQELGGLHGDYQVQSKHPKNACDMSIQPSTLQVHILHLTLSLQEPESNKKPGDPQKSTNH